MTELVFILDRSSTALLDAVGGAIHHIGNIHKYARRDDVPEKTCLSSQPTVMKMQAAATTIKRCGV